MSPVPDRAGRWCLHPDEGPRRLSWRYVAWWSEDEGVEMSASQRTPAAARTLLRMEASRRGLTIETDRDSEARGSIKPQAEA